MALQYDKDGNVVGGNVEWLPPEEDPNGITFPIEYEYDKEAKTLKPAFSPLFIMLEPVEGIFFNLDGRDLYGGHYVPLDRYRKNPCYFYRWQEYPTQGASRLLNEIHKIDPDAASRVNIIALLDAAHEFNRIQFFGPCGLAEEDLEEKHYYSRLRFAMNGGTAPELVYDIWPDFKHFLEGLDEVLDKIDAWGENYFVKNVAFYFREISKKAMPFKDEDDEARYILNDRLSLTEFVPAPEHTDVMTDYIVANCVMQMHIPKEYWPKENEYGDLQFYDIMGDKALQDALMKDRKTRPLMEDLKKKYDAYMALIYELTKEGKM